MDFLKISTGFADDVLTLAGWMLNKLEAHGTLHNRQDVQGLEAEVSVGIKPGATGEILVVHGKRLHHYPAQAADPTAIFARGAKVRIVDAGTGVMSVTSCEPGKSTEPATLDENAGSTTLNACAEPTPLNGTTGSVTLNKSATVSSAAPVEESEVVEAETIDSSN